MKKIITTIFLLISISSCGGGGNGSPGRDSGGNNNQNQPFALPGTNSFNFENKTNDQAWLASEAEANFYRTVEYEKQWGLEAIHAAKSYAVLQKNNMAIAGNGVKVVIIDSGIDQNHIDLNANINFDDSFNYADNNANFSDYDDKHGSKVASIASGVKNNLGIHGVAFDSEIVVAKVFSENSAEVESILSAIEGASQINGVKVMNASLGYGSYSSYDGQTNGASFNDLILINNLINNVKNNDILLVVAAGNDGDNYNDGQGFGANPDYLNHPKPSKPALFANNSDLEYYVLAVGSVNEDGRISDFSNRCGVAKNYCLVAPGEGVSGSFSDVGGDFISTNISGTSFAAPFVSGAAAVLRSAWPHLTASQTAQILLFTATDFGEPGIDEIYGRGMLNLYGAIQSYGPDNIIADLKVSSNQGFTSSSSSIFSDPIFGDSFSSKVAPKLKDAVFFDAFGRDYNASLDKKISLNSSRSMINNFNQNLLNQYDNKQIPLSFTNSNNLQTKFNFKFLAKNHNYQNLITRDQIQEEEMFKRNQGFSFLQNLTRNSSFGFAFNVDEIKNNDEILPFFSMNSLNENPFQNFVNQGFSQINNTQKTFNQLFVNHNLFENKLKLQFSHQSSYFSDSLHNLNSRNDNLQNQLSDVKLQFAKNNDENFTISFGFLNEFDDNILNSKSLGAFSSSNNTKTNYIKFSSVKNIYENIFLVANFSEGRTSINGDKNGIFREFSEVKTRSISFGFFTKNLLNYDVGLIYHEPMRVYSGEVKIDIPIARDIAGNITRFQDQISLKPNGKEQNLELFFKRNLQKNSNISLNFLAIKDSLNVQRQGLDYLTFVNYKKFF